MSTKPNHPRLQSVVETIAIVAIAVAVGWMAITRTASSQGRPMGNTAPTRRPEAPMPAAPLSLAGAQLLGQKSAKLALVIYSDFQCPFCARFARETLPALKTEYVADGRLLVAFRQFPLPIHREAQQAAEAAECAGRQGQFWAYHDRLFENPKALGRESLMASAQELTLDTAAFETCLNGEAVAVVRADYEGGGPLGVSGTPTFFAGPLLADGTVHVSQRFSGALPAQQFRDTLDRLLLETGKLSQPATR